MPGPLHALDDGAMPVIEPTWHLAWPESQGVGSVAISPDDRFAYIQVIEDAVDVWALLVMHWRISAGVVLGLIALAALLWVVRVMRRPRRAGVAYCAKCNYDLSALGSAVTCPECGQGVAAMKPRIGRARWRRLAVPVAVMVAAGAGYGSLFLVSAAGWAEVNSAAFWPSTRLMEWGTGWAKPWFGPARTAIDRIVEVDLAEGRSVRTLITERVSHTGVCLSPDGESLFRTSGSHLSRLVQIDVRTGKHVKFADFPGWVLGHAQHSPVVGCSRDGGEVYVEWRRARDGANGVSAWRLADGAVTTFVTTAAYVRDADSRGLGGSFIPLTNATGMSFFPIPDLSSAYGERNATAELHWGTGATIATRAPREIRPVSESVVSRTLGVLFVRSDDGREIVEFDLRNGVEAGRISVPTNAESFGRQFALSSDERRLFVPVGMGDVLIWDMKAREWVATLRIPAGLHGPEVSDSPTGRWVAAVCQRSLAAPNASGNRGAHELVIWDVGGVVK